MTPLVVLSLWIGMYPKTFVDYVQQPVAAVVRQVRPDYPMPGMPPAAAPAEAPTRAAKY
jgi:NADH:ubiquinone oxidoreductase subunit 4 (subunit M)